MHHIHFPTKLIFILDDCKYYQVKILSVDPKFQAPV